MTAPLDVSGVMDPIGSIKIAKDTTFAMLLEAQRRGHRLHYVSPGGLSVRDGRAVATVAPLQVRDVAGDHYTLGDWSTLSFGPGQVVLMRTDPPVDADYLHDTQILSLAQAQGARVLRLSLEAGDEALAAAGTAHAARLVMAADDPMRMAPTPPVAPPADAPVAADGAAMNGAASPDNPALARAG